MVSTSLAVVAAAAWIVTIVTAAGMNSGMMAGMVVGQGPAGVGFFLLAWTVMMIAMMIPAAIPMAQAYVILGVERAESDPRSKWRSMEAALFLGSYVLVWTLFGVGIAALYAVLASGLPELGMTGSVGPALAGATLVAAGIYQATPLKRICLSTCRSPLSFLMEHWEKGARGALKLGLRHAGFCVGCCWLLFLVLFAVGVMSLPWMALLAAVIFVEKSLPNGDRAAIPVGAAFIALGIALLAAPGPAGWLLGAPMAGG